MKGTIRWWFNPKYTPKERKYMSELTDKVFDGALSLDDVPKEYREAINCALNSN